MYFSSNFFRLKIRVESQAKIILTFQSRLNHDSAFFSENCFPHFKCSAIDNNRLKFSGYFSRLNMNPYFTD